MTGLGGLLILSIDLVTEQGPAISLAYEPVSGAAGGLCDVLPFASHTSHTAGLPWVPKF